MVVKHSMLAWKMIEMYIELLRFQLVIIVIKVLLGVSRCVTTTTTETNDLLFMVILNMTASL